MQKKAETGDSRQESHRSPQQGSALVPHLLYATPECLVSFPRIKHGKDLKALPHARAVIGVTSTMHQPVWGKKYLSPGGHSPGLAGRNEFPRRCFPDLAQDVCQARFLRVGTQAAEGYVLFLKQLFPSPLSKSSQHLLLFLIMLP